MNNTDTSGSIQHYYISIRKIILCLSALLQQEGGGVHHQSDRSCRGRGSLPDCPHGRGPHLDLEGAGGGRGGDGGGAEAPGQPEKEESLSAPAKTREKIFTFNVKK